jgi:hypothetical protein
MIVAGQETVDQRSTISARGFGYRNCTDFVAYELGFDASVVHGNAAQWKAQVPPEKVTSRPTVGAVAWWGPELFGGFGHVAVVLSVNADGSSVVGEYNYSSDGTYDTRIVPPRGADAFLHIRDQAVPGGIAFSPPWASPPPAPRPAPSPPPPPAPPAPSPSPSPPPATPPPPSPDPRRAVADSLDHLGPAFVSFRPPGVMRSGVSQLVEARIDRADQLASRMDLSPGTLLSANLEGPDFRVAATTPAEQAVAGTSVAVWQWEVTPRRRGSRRLTLCLSVDPAPSGAQPSSPTCSLRRSVRVAAAAPPLAGSGAWLVAAALVAAVATAAAALHHKRARLQTR